MTTVYVIAAIAYAAFLVAVWLLAAGLGLSGSDAWIFGGLLALIGASAAGLIVYLLRRKRAAARAVTGGGLVSDVEFQISEANSRLRASAAKKTIAELPLILVVGESGSCKTTTVVHSGTSPELLSGKAGAEGQPEPTPALNVWLSAGTVMVEAGGALLNDQAGWRRLIELVSARRWSNWLGRSAQAPRAVVLCVETGSVVSAGPAIAKKMQERLGAAAEGWGSRVPVYVLFTKGDQVPYFADFVRNFANPEVEGVFGAALPMLAESPGAYNAAQSARLAAAFDGLFSSVAEKRIDQLRRENEPGRLPNIYEFPREFRKLRDGVVRFLLDAGRPSQLRTSPFLRGFYFSGVRPVSADVPAAPAPVAASYGDAGATRIFSAAQAQQALAARTAGTRRVPQWVFVRQFFTHVLLADRTALGASGSDAQAGVMRRVLLGTAAAALLVWIAGATVSWWNNRALLLRADAAARALAAVRPTAGQPPTAETWRHLEDLRSAAEQITRYQRSGAPLGYRWGLFGGEAAYANVRGAWCRQFGRHVLEPVRSGMAVSLAGLRTPAGPADDYQSSFRTLKAYLMTTSHPDKTDAAFLSDALAARWAVDTRAAGQDVQFARNQFGFYSAERATGLCGANADANAVESARSHLWSFPLVERIYRNIVGDVSRQGAPLRFRDPSGAVLNGYEVAYAFTPDGWQRVQRSISDGTSRLGREPWVLGDERSGGGANAQELQAQLRQKYLTDYVAQWQAFLNAGAIAGYASFKDAAQKLGGFAGTKPPLLDMFCMISTNTAVPNSPELAKEFRGFQQLEDPNTCRDIPNGGPTQPYMAAVTTLHLRVDELAKLPSLPPDASIDGSMARAAARTSAQTLGLPPKADALMQQPIIQVERLAQGLGPESMNGKGRDFCQETTSVFGRFPFNPKAREDAALADVMAVLQPGTGKLWQFQQQNLQELVISTGVGFAPKSGARVRVSPAYLDFLSRAAALSRALFPNNAARPALTYSMQSRPSPGVEGFTVTSGGKTLNATGRGGESVDAQWSGNPETATLTVKGVQQQVSGSGVWAMWHMLASADRVSEGETVYEYDVQSRLGRQSQGGTATATVKLRITGPGGGGLLRQFATGCVSRIAN